MGYRNGANTVDLTAGRPSSTGSDTANFSRRLITRLQRYEFALVAPCGETRDDSTAVKEIRELRSEVYHEFGSLPGRSNESADRVDEFAWHIIVRLEGTLIGCVRCVVFDDPLALDIADRILRYSHCVLSEGDRTRSVAAIRSFVAARRPRSSTLVQIGGLAVSRRFRRSCVAVGLCVAANAFTRAIGSGGGVMLAAEKSRPETLFHHSGGFRLDIGGEILPPLNDSFHRDRIIVMGTAPFGNTIRLEAVVEHFTASLFRELIRPEVNCA